jgi:hypothetical protein
MACRGWVGIWGKAIRFKAGPAKRRVGVLHR